MGLPDISDVCIGLDVETGLDLRLGVDLSVALKDLKISLPGGIKLQAKASQKIPNPGDLVADLLASLNAALAPFQPIFDLMDIAMVIIKVFEAVKSLNPIKIADELLKLIAKVDVVASYIPPLSLPIMIRDTIDTILVFLAGLKASLTVSLSAQLKIDAATAKASALADLSASLEASGDLEGAAAMAALSADLNVSVGCAQANLDCQLAAQANAMGPLNRFLTLLSSLCEAVGLPALPGLDMSAGGDITVAIDAVDALIAALTIVRAAIPI